MPCASRTLRSASAEIPAPSGVCRIPASPRGDRPPPAGLHSGAVANCANSIGTANGGPSSAAAPRTPRSRSLTGPPTLDRGVAQSLAIESPATHGIRIVESFSRLPNRAGGSQVELSPVTGIRGADPSQRRGYHQAAWRCRVHLDAPPTRGLDTHAFCRHAFVPRVLIVPWATWRRTRHTRRDVLVDGAAWRARGIHHLEKRLSSAAFFRVVSHSLAVADRSA